MDWHAWYGQYDDPASPLSRRLRLVQQRLAEALDAAPGPIDVLSLCAGDGRDVLGVLQSHRRAEAVRAVLIEADPELAERARSHAPPTVQVVTGDAAAPDVFGPYAPADVLMLCGIFGNISDDDVRTTIESAPGLCRPGGVVLWTRHRRPPDLTPSVRQWFAGAGFQELFFDEVEGGPSVGGHRYSGAPRPAPQRPLFTFVRQ